MTVLAVHISSLFAAKTTLFEEAVNMVQAVETRTSSTEKTSKNNTTLFFITIFLLWFPGIRIYSVLAFIISLSTK